MNRLKSLLILLSGIAALFANAQYTALDSISAYLSRALANSAAIPREKVYLHLDNTSYYRGDKIYFAAYVVNSALNTPANLSGTLYVELLKPGGQVVDRRVLRIVNGRCHGELNVDAQPFYSGFYEVRAYTKYMLNFGDSELYSRLVPVFDPGEKMLAYGAADYDYRRPRPQADPSGVKMKFYPEGGHLVHGLPGRVAFELTDGSGTAVDATGHIISAGGDTLAALSTAGGGRGVFDYVARPGDRAVAVVAGKSHSFALPEAEPQGISLTVDNLSDSVSVGVNISRSDNLPVAVFGATLTCRGKLCGRFAFDLSEEPAAGFQISRASLPTGIIQLTVFDASGRVWADRLFFNDRHDCLAITSRISSASAAPFEPVDVELHAGEPAPFSLSIRSADRHVARGSDIFADMLLASEIKGYVRTPADYFMPGGERALDCLLMVQGWRKYSWQGLMDMEPIEIVHMPEGGIEVHGRVVSNVRGIPQAGVSVNTMLSRRLDENPDSMVIFYDAYTTDSLGNFAFRTDVDKNWNLFFAVEENGKKKNHRLLLDAFNSPAPRAYHRNELQVAFGGRRAVAAGADTIAPEENLTYDRVDEAGAMSRVLKEVEVDGDRSSLQWEISQNRETSRAFFDVEREYNAIIDRGERKVKRLADLLMELDRHFDKFYSSAGEEIRYKGKEPLFVIDYEPHFLGVLDSTAHQSLYIEAIKSIYINENPTVIIRYAYRNSDPMNMESRAEIERKYGCAVLIETYPDKRTKPRNGARRITLEGYTPVEEFYSPDYSVMPPADDRRRTLYWNPEVVHDSTGAVSIRFYNGSIPTSGFIISAESVTPSGHIMLTP